MESVYKYYKKILTLVKPQQNNNNNTEKVINASYEDSILWELSQSSNTIFDLMDIFEYLSTSKYGIFDEDFMWIGIISDKNELIIDVTFNTIDTFDIQPDSNITKDTTILVIQSMLAMWRLVHINDLSDIERNIYNSISHYCNYETNFSLQDLLSLCDTIKRCFVSL